MGFTLNEVQITCIVLMGLMTLILAFVFPRYVNSGGIYNYARGLLVCATTLLSAHFIVQYVIHKPVLVSEDMRTFVNLLFGMPYSYFFSMSYYYLHRNGSVQRWVWLLVPSIYFSSLLFTYLSYFVASFPVKIDTALVVMAVCYAAVIITCSVLEIREYIRMTNDIKSGDNSQAVLVRWTRWSMFLMIVAGIGQPFAIFSSSIIFRGIFGIFSISIAFFYIFSFIGYGLSNVKKEEKKSTDSAYDQYAHIFEEKTELTDEESRMMDNAVREWLKQHKFIRNGLTMQDVAEDMNVDRELFRLWLLNTRFKQFNAWLNVLRIEESKKLLIMHPEWSNETVAKACGFSERSYFQRIFRDYVGKTPTKWIEDRNNTGGAER